MGYVGSNMSCTQPAQEALGVSSGVGSGHGFGSQSDTSSGELFSAGARPFDLHRYRVLFPDRWMAFLHRSFRDPVHVAFMFGVSERTARNWWEGVSAPRAEFALAACKHVPGAAEFLMEAA